MSHDALGSGPPILLLHSGVCDRRMWRPQVDARRARYSVDRPKPDQSVEQPPTLAVVDDSLPAVGL